MEASEIGEANVVKPAENTFSSPSENACLYDRQLNMETPLSPLDFARRARCLYGDPEATAASIRDGWFHSADAAVVDPDGYIEIRDRWKDVIISGGENISSVEVEGSLLRHPAIQESAVVGMPHEKWGETPHAFIVLKPWAETTPEILRQFCRDHLAHFKVPHEFQFLTELPKTATGKIQKYILRGGKANLERQ